ncbi:MAG: actin-bundling T4SS effector WalE1 family protein, partial [Wolbachia sp.]
MLNSQETNSVSNKKQSSIFTETFNKLFRNENKDSSMFDRFSSLNAKEKMLAVSAVGAIAGALLPVVLVALPGAAVGIAAVATIAAVALTLFFAYKAVEYTLKGLKWSAEKTVDGAKYTAEKVKDASVYTAEKAREGYHSVKGAISSVKRATREGTGATLGKMGRSLSNLSESMSSLDAIPYSIGNEGQTVVLKTEEKTRNFNSVKEMFVKEVFEDKAVNSSALTKEIFSKLGEKILEKAYSVDGQQGFKKDQLINQLKQQADFVNKLDAKKLQSLLAKDNNSLYEIFSDHHDEIKRIIKECKIRGSNVEKQLHEPFSSDLGVLDKTATIGQKPSGKQSIPVALPKVPE